ncbi:glycosyltransferase family 2 protein [Sphingomonas yunnanensis]|uniref:glycosyltransferase family A protein n=1 Tax=Sphingomonas yunnanensis TaxID=310400 RepID=UPI001CA61AC0|nr:glycosyltransferase family A protein [Sphingomonas yunnanensis]MBY9063467.1 glycosyltransferase family 2 protein [Sphingomonas yunnanensis]
MTDDRDRAAEAPEFTIFTATYDRAGTLERLFDSIARQTYRGFEWLVVDDGSTDATPALLAGLAARAAFPVRYFRQPNGGKHVAFDRGVREARGALFLTIDSDDELLPDALATLAATWHAIPARERAHFTGVTGRCVDQHGSLVGAPVARSPVDSDSAEATFILGWTGERVGFHRTEVLRAHPFPRGVESRFIPEGRVWLDIARRYKTRFIETPVRVFHDHDAPRLSALDRVQRAPGDLEYYRFALNHYAHWWWRAPGAIAKLAVGLRRAERHLDTTVPRDSLPLAARLLLLAAGPLAAMARARDLRVRRRNAGC